MKAQMEVLFARGDVTDRFSSLPNPFLMGPGRRKSGKSSPSGLTVRIPTPWWNFPRGCCCKPTPWSVTIPRHKEVDVQPLVGVLVGSKSDWGAMGGVSLTLASLGIPFEAR